MTKQIEYSASDDDRIRLTNAMLFVALKRLGGFMVVRQEDIAAAFSTGIKIEHDELDDGRLRVRAVDAPLKLDEEKFLSESPLAPGVTAVVSTIRARPKAKAKTKKPARKAPKKKAKAKAKKGKR